MKQFACGDVVPGCTRVFRGSPDDILAEVAAHARDDHGLVQLPEAVVTQVRARMTEVS